MKTKQVEQAADTLKTRIGEPPEVGIILGSGLAPLADMIDVDAELRTSHIPNYPPSTVVGHDGVFLAGRLGQCRVLILKGRVHSYEGYKLDQVTLPVRLMALAGVKTLVLTNAAGGINSDFTAGDIMLVEDQINLQGRSPLRGPNVDDWGPRFPDMSEIYDAKLRKLAYEIAELQEIELQHGIYASVPGPQYESPAEVRMLKTLGADAVGMSTAPEAIVARHMGLKVIGFSVISNLAAGISPTPLNHDEVVEAGNRVGARLSRLIGALLPRLAEES